MAAVFGSTGLVGSYILSNLLAIESIKPVTAIARRAPKSTGPTLNAVVDADTTKWAAALSALTPIPSVVYSGLGTTRAAAGGIDKQWLIDHDLNVELAKAAKAAGVKTYVFISAAGARSFPSNMSPYAKMKIGVEDAIKELDFEHSIIVQPALILGERDHARTLEGWSQSLVRTILPQGMKDKIAQEGEVIARAAIKAAQLASEGKAPNKHWEVGPSDIIKLGRTEWAAAEKAEE